MKALKFRTMKDTVVTIILAHVMLVESSESNKELVLTLANGKEVALYVQVEDLEVMNSLIGAITSSSKVTLEVFNRVLDEVNTYFN